MLDGSEVANFTALNKAMTAKEAKEALMGGIAKQQSMLYRRTYMFCVDGTVLALYYAMGWAYDIIDPTRVHPCSCSMGDITEQEARERMLRHAEQSYGGPVHP
jgi:hypothetical protein